MDEIIVLLMFALFAILYIFGYVHDFIFWLCDKREGKRGK